MVKHQQCKSVSDVDTFLNENKLRLDQVQIVHVVQKFGGMYMVFYEVQTTPASE